MKHSKFIVLMLFAGLMSCKNNNREITKVNHDDFKTIHSNFKIKSIAIENGVLLDAYKCEEKVNDVENSIPLSWENVPEGTKSLVVIGLWAEIKTEQLYRIRLHVLVVKVSMNIP